MTEAPAHGPDLAQLEADAEQATQATQAAVARVAELESLLEAARATLENAKAHEMEARRAFVVAKDAAGSASAGPA